MSDSSLFPGSSPEECPQPADELQRDLDGEPIHPEPRGTIVRTARWCRRHKAMTFSIGAFIAVMLYLLISVILGVGAFGLLWLPRGTDSSHGFRPAYGWVDEDGTLVTPTVMVERLASYEEALEWADVGGVVFRFTSGYGDPDAYAGGSFRAGFHTGGHLEVWIELERHGELHTFFEDVFDLTAQPADSTGPEAIYVLMRSPRRDDGSEWWRNYTRCSRMGASDNASITRREVGRIIQTEAGRIQVWSGPQRIREVLAETPERLTTRERAFFESDMWFTETNPSATVIGSSIGRWITAKQGATTGLWTASETFEFALNREREKVGLPKRPEKPEFTIRVVCRLLTDEEVAEMPNGASRSRKSAEDQHDVKPPEG